jgi:class 3 adenylate cyclase
MMRNTTRKFALAAAVLALGASSALAAGPFAEFSGTWKGAGRVSDKQGKSEALTCRSTNTPQPDGIAMSFALVCASDSYKVDFHCELFTDGKELHGTWTETTRQAEGNVHGSIGQGFITAITDAPGFSATIAVRMASASRMDVDLKAHGNVSIDHVAVTMKR